MHLDFSGLLPMLLQAATVVAGGVVASKLHNQTDVMRATAIAKVAEDAAAAAIANNPKLPWLRLVEETVKQLSAASGLPTRSTAVLTRAAKGALMRLGKAPDVPAAVK